MMKARWNVGLDRAPALFDPIPTKPNPTQPNLSPHPLAIPASALYQKAMMRAIPDARMK